MQRRELRFQRHGFLGRTHQSVQPRLGGKTGQTQYLLLRRDIQADAGQIVLLHAGQNGDANQQRRGAGHAGQGLATGRHHPQATGAMHVDHPHTQLGSGFHRHRRGVGDVMEFEVEEDFEIHCLQRLDDRWAAASEQLLADLHPTQPRIELPGQCQCGIAGGEVERYDNRSLAGHGMSSRNSARIVAENVPCDESLGAGSKQA